MTGLANGATLLSAWETAASAPEVARGAAVLAQALGSRVEDVLDLPLGECGRLALLASIDAFGELAEVSCPCTNCGEINEAPVDLRTFLAGPTADHMVVDSADPIIVRALTTRDLLTAGSDDDPAASLRRRVVRQRDRELSDAELDELVRRNADALDNAAESLAGSASIPLRMRCPGCAVDFAATLDPAELLWERVAASAPALLAQVATLAAAYGWTERDVLDMSEQRRRAYLDLAGERQGVRR